MNNTEILEDIDDSSKKRFYKPKMIYVSTFLGGPLAGSWLIRKNFMNQGKERQATNALIIGIVTTVLIFVALFSLPVKTIDSVPRFIIPAIYTFITYLIVNKLQTPQLLDHEKHGGKFYSAWRVTGITVICLIITTTGILSYDYLNKVDYEKYNEGLANFQENEEEAITVYEYTESGRDQEAVNFIEEKGLALWEENLKILDKMDKVEGIEDVYLEQNNILREYCELRIESLELLKSSIEGSYEDYEKELNAVYSKIDEQLTKLEQLNAE